MIFTNLLHNTINGILLYCNLFSICLHFTGQYKMAIDLLKRVRKKSDFPFCGICITDCTLGGPKYFVIPG